MSVVDRCYLLSPLLQAGEERRVGMALVALEAADLERLVGVMEQPGRVRWDHPVRWFGIEDARAADGAVGLALEQASELLRPRWLGPSVAEGLLSAELGEGEVFGSSIRTVRFQELSSARYGPVRWTFSAHRSRLYAAWMALASPDRVGAIAGRMAVHEPEGLVWALTHGVGPDVALQGDETRRSLGPLLAPDEVAPLLADGSEAMREAALVALGRVGGRSR